jgi:hypothetical protein
MPRLRRSGFYGENVLRWPLSSRRFESQALTHLAIECQRSAIRSGNGAAVPNPGQSRLPPISLAHSFQLPRSNTQITPISSVILDLGLVNGYFRPTHMGCPILIVTNDSAIPPHAF